MVERWNIGFPKDNSHFNFIVNPAGGGTINPTLHYPRTHDSNIPEFQHSNWGEAPNLYRRQVSGVSVRVASYGLRVKVFHLCLLTSVS